MKKILILSLLVLIADVAKAALGVNFIAGPDTTLSATNGAGGVDLAINHVSYSNSLRLVVGLDATNYAAVVSNSVRLVAGLASTNYANVVSNSVRLVAGLDATNYAAVVSNSVRLVAGLASTNAIAAATNILALNVATQFVTNNVFFVPATVAGTGGALTNFALLSTYGFTTINGATNVSIRGVGGFVAGRLDSWSLLITNGSGANRTLEFSPATNAWKWVLSSAAPTVMTNGTQLLIEAKQNGSNILARGSYFLWP